MAASRGFLRSCCSRGAEVVGEMEIEPWSSRSSSAKQQAEGRGAEEEEEEEGAERGYGSFRRSPEEEEEDDDDAGRSYGSFNGFPEELVQQVVSYMPFHEMIRARLVCRSWLSALTSPNFLSLWSLRSAPSLWLLRYNSLDSAHFAFHPLSKLSLPIPRPPGPHSIVASSRGLICYLHPSSLSLFNPFARLSFLVPLPNSILPSFRFGFAHQQTPLNRLYIIACDFRSDPSPRAQLYDSAVRNWVPLPQPPTSSTFSERLPRSTKLFVWWNGKFCVLWARSVVMYDVSSFQWRTVDLPENLGVWNSHYLTLHAIRGRLFLEGNLQVRSRVAPRPIGILELHPTTLHWEVLAYMPMKFAQLLCNDPQPLHSKYTSYSDADCDHICFSPFPTDDKEPFVSYDLEKDTWTSMQISHRRWHCYFGSSNFKGWALQPAFTVFPEHLH